MNLKSFNITAIPKQDVIIAFLLDLAALAVVYFTPALCDLIKLPFWMIEPMRLMVIVSLVHSTRFNSFLLALTLPLFAWAVLGHPGFDKMIIMTVEMAVNVFVYYFLVRRTQAVFISMLIAIVASKILCYTLYLVFSSVITVNLEEETETGFLIAQVITTLVFSGYALLILRKKRQ
jgi:hypothetical protein